MTGFQVLGNILWILRAEEHTSELQSLMRCAGFWRGVSAALR